MTKTQSQSRKRVNIFGLALSHGQSRPVIHPKRREQSKVARNGQKQPKVAKKVSRMAKMGVLKAPAISCLVGWIPGNPILLEEFIFHFV